VRLKRAILSAHGLEYTGDYTFVQAGANPQRRQALQDDKITAELLRCGYPAEEAGFKILAWAEDYVPFFTLPRDASDGVARSESGTSR
jgi:hypothetical protein